MSTAAWTSDLLWPVRPGDLVRVVDGISDAGVSVVTFTVRAVTSLRRGRLVVTGDLAGGASGEFSVRRYEVVILSRPVLPTDG